MNRKGYTIKSHLRGKDRMILLLYERFVELVKACGPFDYVVGKDGIAFKGQRRNFAVAKPKARSLDGVLVLPRRLADDRIRNVRPYTKRLFGNQFRLTELDQVDNEFATWILEAYQVGEGQHLSE